MNLSDFFSLPLPGGMEINPLERLIAAMLTPRVEPRKPTAPPRNPWGKPTGVLAAARQLGQSYGSAGFRVLNEYEKPVPWATGGHLHVEWSPGQDRKAMLNRLQQIASDLGYDIHVGGLTAKGHRGRAHKEFRAADISGIRKR